MSIVYLLLETLYTIMFLLMKKTKKKENILTWISLSIIILMCFNIFITFIFNILNIKISLTALSLISIVRTILVVIILYKTKEIQKYYIRIRDIIVAILLLAIICVVAYIQFSFPFNIYYEVTDASNHYSAAINFYNSSELLTTQNSSDIFGVNQFQTFMTGSYVNLGILFKTLGCFLTSTKDFVNVSIIFELFILYLSGILIYSLLNNKEHKTKEYIVVVVFTILYMLGYPLNSEISGFSYLSLGLNIIITIMIFMRYLLKEEINNTIGIIILFLLNLGLFFTYYFFAPVVYISILTILIISIKKRQEKIISIKNLITFIYILILPFLCGIYYFYIKELLKGSMGPGFNAINAEGYIYSNLISNFILFIPPLIAYFYYEIKNKNINFLNTLIFFELLFAMILGIGLKYKYVSSYYFYKSYYLLWMLIIISSYSGTIILINKNTIPLKIVCIFAYAIMLLCCYKYDNLKKLFDIYYTNYSIIQKKDNTGIDHKYFEIIDYYKNNLSDKKDNIYIIASDIIGKNRWLYQLYDNPYFFVNFMIIGKDEQNTIESWINGEIEQKYIIYDKKELNYEPFENEKYTILYNNEEGAILERK